jgi:hypothetical protein
VRVRPSISAKSCWSSLVIDVPTSSGCPGTIGHVDRNLSKEASMRFANALLRSARAARRGRVAIAFVLIAGVVAVPTAWATHIFTDVPDSSPHHDDVARIAGAGITAGCAPALYCPSDPVRRDQMASFMGRGFGRLATTPAGGFAPLTDTGWTTLNTLTITTGGVPGGTGFVKLDAAVSARIQSTTGCPCAAQFHIQNVTDGTVTDHSFTHIDALGAGSSFGFDSTGLTWVVQVQTATTYTFAVRGRTENSAASVSGRGVLTALYAPFGSQGTSEP